jgi:hypothetical protein
MAMSTIEREEGRGKREEGRGKREEGRGKRPLEKGRLVKIDGLMSPMMDRFARSLGWFVSCLICAPSEEENFGYSSTK